MASDTLPNLSPITARCPFCSYCPAICSSVLSCFLSLLIHTLFPAYCSHSGSPGTAGPDVWLCPGHLPTVLTLVSLHYLPPSPNPAVSPIPPFIIQCAVLTSFPIVNPQPSRTTGEWIRKWTSESNHLGLGLLVIGLTHLGKSLNLQEMRG